MNKISKYHDWKIVVPFFFLWVGLYSSFIYARSNNTVIIRGHGPKHQRSFSGHNVKTVPQSSQLSWQSSEAHFKNESGFLSDKTGEPSANGYFTPRIRGQHPKLTYIYLNDFLLSEPYTGLPFVDDLDFRIFDTMQIYQGLPPAALATTHPIGTIHYETTNQQPDTSVLGASYGNVSGEVYWLHHIRHFYQPWHNDLQKATFRLYARTHKSSGAYSYYDDNSTPYNSSDDFVTRRQDNFKQAQVISPAVSWRFKNHSVSFFNYLTQAHKGLPSRRSQQPSLAHEYKTHNLHLINYTYHISPPSFWKMFSFLIAQHQAKIQIKDPLRNILGTTDSAQFNLMSQHIATKQQATYKQFNLYLAQDYSASQVSHLHNHYKRSQAKGYAGIDYHFARPWKLELKTEYALLHNTNTTQTISSQHHSQGHGINLTYQAHQSWLLYAQYGNTRRPPSLIEELGDGGAIASSQDLKSETIRHKEIGFKWHYKKIQYLELALYSDQYLDQIIILPISSYRAQAVNLDSSEIQGFHFNSHSALKFLNVHLNYTRYQTHLTNNHLDLKIPLIADQIWVIELQKHFFYRFSCSSLSRRRGQIYWDARNTQKTDPLWIHDISCDYNQDKFQLGFELKNIFDQKTANIDASSGASGKTAYSDMLGYPLPGRHYRLSAAWNF